MSDVVLAPASTLTRNPDLFASEIDDELVMMDDAQGLYFALNPVGRAVWEKLSTPMAYGALLEALVAAYAVTPEQCEKDVTPFLQKMIGQGLVRVDSVG